MTTQQDERTELIQFAKDHTIGGSEFNRKMAKITALLEADAKGGEAVGYVNADNLQGMTLGHYSYAEIYSDDSAGRIPVYTRPQQAAQPLTEQEVDRLIEKHAGGAEWTDDEYRSAVKLLRSVEAAHGITTQTPHPQPQAQGERSVCPLGMVDTCCQEFKNCKSKE